MPAQTANPGLARKRTSDASKGPKKETRRISKALAVAAREAFPEGVMMDYLFAIMEGHGQAIMARDEDGEPYVTWPEEGEMASTPEQRQWAWTQARQAGWGMPAQHHVIDGEIRQHTTTLAVTADLDLMTPGAIHAIRGLIMGRPAEPATPELAPAPAIGALDAPIDAEFTDSGGDEPPAGADSARELSESDE